MSENRKDAGGSLCASRLNVARFIRRCDRPCRISPSGVRNHNRPNWMPERRHRRPDLHGRILRCPAAPPRVACYGVDRSTSSPNQIDVRARFRPADAMGLVAVDVQRPRARHRLDNALRQALRHRRERGLSGMRHTRGVGRHARQQARQVGRTRHRAANRLSVAIPPTMRAIAMADRGLRSPKL